MDEAIENAKPCKNRTELIKEKPYVYATLYKYKLLDLLFPKEPKDVYKKEVERVLKAVKDIDEAKLIISKSRKIIEEFWVLKKKFNRSQHGYYIDERNKTLKK